MTCAYKMEPWALGADLNFLSVIFFTSPPLPSPAAAFAQYFPFFPSLSLSSFFSAITLADCNL